MAGKQRTIVYCLKSPSGRQYIGITGQPLRVRWQQHCKKARTGIKHPLYAAIRKYGAKSFEVSELSTHATRAEALLAEVKKIAEFPDRYNISPGGAGDGIAGAEKLKELLKDERWRTCYRKKLVRALQDSERHNTPEHIEGMCKKGEEWRKKNPKIAFEMQRRATRCAAKSATTTGVNKRKRENKAPNKMQVAKRRKAAVVKMWSGRTPEQKAEVSRKIKEGMERFNRGLTKAQKAERDAQMKEARQRIDHVQRKAAQKKAVQEYWTLDRREAFSKLVKKRRMQKNES